MWKSYRRFSDELREEWPRLLVSLLAMVVLAMASAGYVALTGPLLKGVFMSGPLEVDFGVLGKIPLGDSARAAKILPVLIVLLSATKGVAQAVQFTLNGGVALRAVRRLRARAFDRLLQLSPRFYQGTNTADVVGRLTTDSERVELAVFNGMMPVVRDSLSILAMFGTCIVLDPWLSLSICVAAPAVALPLARFSKWLKRVSRVSADQMSVLAFSAFESVSGIRTVQAFGIEAYEKQRFERSGEKHAAAMTRSYLIRGVRSPLMETLGAAGIAALIYYLSQSVAAGKVDATHVAAFVAAVILMYDPIKKLGNVGDQLALGAAALDRIYELVDAPVDIPMTHGNDPVVNPSGAVTLHDVHFAYGEAAVLSGVSLKVEPGQVCALVGRSGAGKSTVMNLLLRFYDPTAGVITLEGVALKEWPLSALRRHMAWVSQDVFLFNASVRENLALGEGHDEAALWSALKSAHADGFVKALPQGLDTSLGERGASLSGGQRQRLAIARAFLRNARVLLLDEATSALDTESEQAVQAALETLMKGRTTIVIAHRLSTVRHADVIAVLDAGKVVQVGTHDALKDAAGIYQMLVSAQRDGALGAGA
jgi:ATP-binding cassette, subfamily B, bacterial MsbA